MSKRNDKNAISMDPQKTGRILGAREVGKPGLGRWVVQDGAGSTPPAGINGVAQPTLIAESDGYVRPEVNRTILQRDYDQAPIHRVEIWRHPPSGGFHVRIFDAIS